MPWGWGPRAEFSFFPQETDSQRLTVHLVTGLVFSFLAGKALVIRSELPGGLPLAIWMSLQSRIIESGTCLSLGRPRCELLRQTPNGKEKALDLWDGQAFSRGYCQASARDNRHSYSPQSPVISEWQD